MIHSSLLRSNFQSAGRGKPNRVHSLAELTSHKLNWRAQARVVRSHRTGYQKRSYTERRLQRYLERSLHALVMYMCWVKMSMARERILEINMLNNSWNMGLGIVDVFTNRCGQIL